MNLAWSLCPAKSSVSIHISMQAMTFTSVLHSKVNLFPTCLFRVACHHNNFAYHFHLLISAINNILLNTEVIHTGPETILLFYKQSNIARHNWPTHGLLHCSLDIWCMKALHHYIYWFQVLFMRLVTVLRWLICPSAPPSHFKFSHAVQSWSAT